MSGDEWKNSTLSNTKLDDLFRATTNLLDLEIANAGYILLPLNLQEMIKIEPKLQEYLLEYYNTRKFKDEIQNILNKNFDDLKRRMNR